VALIIGIGASYISAFTQPSGAPPAGNINAPIHTGNAVQEKSGTFRSGAIRSLSDLIVDGKLGVGTTTPRNALDVIGTVRIQGGTVGNTSPRSDTVFNWEDGKNYIRGTTVVKGDICIEGGGGKCLGSTQVIRFDKWVEGRSSGGSGHMICNSGWIQTGGGNYTSNSDNEKALVRCTRVDPTFSNPAISCPQSNCTYTNSSSPYDI
jgi:hypothetical protein